MAECKSSKEEKEIERRRDEALKQALGMKPKPHKEKPENKNKGGGRRPKSR